MASMDELYERGEHLGGGGYGDVYRAARRQDGATVAVKILRDDIPDFRHRFEREVKMHREYTHPGVMKILDADLSATPPYYVMPFYKNGTLKSRIGNVTGPEFLALLEALIAVLVFLEERGAFHRDLKPENILIDDDGRPVVGDFRAANDPALTANFTRHWMGTPGYIAPELSRRRDGASPKCDIYSLGATAFELLTGVHPADARSFDVDDHFSCFPVEIRNTILAMVDPEPARRPGAKELLDWVKQVKREAVDAVVGKAKKVAQKVATPVWVIVLVALLVAGTCAGVGYLFWRAVRTPRREARESAL